MPDVTEWDATVVGATAWGSEPWTATIKVRRCNGYYVYKLARPTHCDMAYCGGDWDPPCAEGSIWVPHQGCRGQ